MNIPSNLRVTCPACGNSLAPTIGRTLPPHTRAARDYSVYYSAYILIPCIGGHMDVTSSIADAIVRDADQQVADIRARIESRDRDREQYASEQRALAEQRIAQYDAETESRRQVLVDAERSARESRSIAESLRGSQ